VKVLILGSSADPHVWHIKSGLESCQVEVECWETNSFPQQTRLSMSLDRDDGIIEFPSGKCWKWSEINSVYWRTFTGVNVPPLENREQYRVAVADADSTLRSFMQACLARWVNPWAAYRFHQEKPLQLRKAKALGLSIPKTLITNSSKEVIDFCSGGERFIFKPVYGGTHTKFVTPEHLDKERLDFALSHAPVTLQKYVPGTNVRSYVIVDRIYSAKIHSPEVDFRSDFDAELECIEIPEGVKVQCLAVTQGFGMEWTAIDWRLSPTGEYIFLEANFSPMFMGFEQQTAFPISRQLVELLMQ
jgi:hypothetical protein